MMATGSKKGHGAGVQSGSISCGIEDPEARVSRRVSRARRSPSAHPAREMWTLRRRGGGEREGELGADFTFNSLPSIQKSHVDFISARPELLCISGTSHSKPKIAFLLILAALEKYFGGTPKGLPGGRPRSTKTVSNDVSFRSAWRQLLMVKNVPVNYGMEYSGPVIALTARHVRHGVGPGPSASPKFCQL